MKIDFETPSEERINQQHVVKRPKSQFCHYRSFGAFYISHSPSYFPDRARCHKIAKEDHFWDFRHPQLLLTHKILRSCDALFDEKMLTLTLFVVAAAAFGSALAQDCPFYPGTCPINVDNVVEVMQPF